MGHSSQAAGTGLQFADTVEVEARATQLDLRPAAGLVFHHLALELPAMSPVLGDRLVSGTHATSRRDADRFSLHDD